MSIQDLLKEREDLDAKIEDELRKKKNWNHTCDCDKVITAELIHYGDPDTGGPAIQIESHCVECGGYVDWR